MGPNNTVLDQLVAEAIRAGFGEIAVTFREGMGT